MIGFLVLAIALSFSPDVAPSGGFARRRQAETGEARRLKKQLPRRHKKRVGYMPYGKWS
jgi:hypothetical protein